MNKLVPIALITASIAHAEPSAIATAPNSALDKSPAELGLDASAKPYGPAMLLHITAAMQEKPKPTDHFKWYSYKLEAVYPGGHCYGLVAMAPAGVPLNIYSGRSRTGDYDSKDHNDKGGKIVSVGSCVSRSTRLLMMFMTQSPADINYRILVAPNPNQKAMEQEDAANEKDCLRSCRSQLHTCNEQKAGQYKGADWCDRRLDECNDACTGEQ